MVKTKRSLIAALIAVIWAVTAVLFLIPNVSATAFLSTFDITGGTIGTDWTYENGVLTVKTPTEITIRNVDPNIPTTDTIIVAKNVSANITLAGVNIDVSTTYGACAFKIEDNSTGNVTITLADGSDNILKSGEKRAGLQKNGSSTDIGNLTISGTGKLTTNGGDDGAGIGGGNGGSGSNITISDGTVTANGGEDAAGIGGGWRSDGSNITISGGTVTANGGVDGAGIGGGDSGSGSNITISGGTVIATGRYCGSGIGGGSEGSGSNIIISGGTVTAAGGTDSNWGGAGIGGGWKGDGDIIISGGSVKAIAGSNANAIGGGFTKPAVTPTDGSGKNVYLLELPAAANTLTIDGKAYPTNHGTDGKVYVYLTEGKHTFVTDGNSETKSYGKNSDNKLEEIGTAFTVTGDNLIYGTDYTYPASTGVLTILSDKKVTISGATTTDTIVVGQNKNADITLDGVDIDVSATYGACAFKIEDDSTGNVTITLADGSTNVLKSGESSAGLQKNGSGDGIGKLTVLGTGKLNATGIYGAGIGGGNGLSTSNITISGGTVTANGGNYAAGIGGGDNGSGSNITISGEIVTAKGGYCGAGIGGGNDASGTNITISGGTVTANSDAYGAGIGGGDDGSGSNIIISGGSLKSVAGYRANAIGGGYNRDAVTPTDGSGENVYLLEIDNPTDDNVYIDGKLYSLKNHKAADSADGKLYAYLTGKYHTVKVGSTEEKYVFDSDIDSLVKYGSYLKITGNNLIYGTDYTYPSSTGVLTILSDKKVTISGTTTTDTIAVGKDKNADITLDGVDINVSATYGACAFKIEDDSTGNVTITLADGSVNVLKSGNSRAGLEKSGSGTDIGKLTISGTGTLTANGGYFGAGIGGGRSGAGSYITISGGTVTATGGYYAASIGGGEGGSGTNITISGGIVTASCSYYGGAGIGGGYNGNGTNITINGGTVIATGGESGAGIGGGSYGTGSNITISDGTVTATGGGNGAGIGGGDGGTGSNITISGGTVTATAILKGAGIGGGYEGSGTNITISGGTVTANSDAYGAGIGGGIRGKGSNIIISGGSVKATADRSANAIGGGYNGNGAVTPTLADKTTPVYLLEIDNPNGKAITINGKAYPTNHGDEKKIYAYLPAKTAADPNTVAVGESSSKYYYNTANSKWYGVADIPDADDTEFIYNGREQTYAIPESTLYTIDGSKQKIPGDYTVTVALTDKVNITWSDGTTEDREYTFTIAKAQPELTVTAKPASDIAGKTVTVTASAVNPENTALDDIPDIVLTYKVGDGDEISFTDSFVIPEGTAIGTVITVKAKTAEDGNYKSSEAETKVNVSDCTHNDVNAKWESDSTGHWHICNYCSENVDFAAHTFGEWKITVHATEAADGKKEHSCTVCGYTEEKVIKYTAALKAAEEAEKVLDDITADNDTTAEDIISKINEAVDDDITVEITTFEKIPATVDSEGSITIVITVTDGDGNTEEIEKTFVIDKLPESDKPQTVYYPISINGNVTADRTSAKAGDIVNVSTAFGYDIIVTSNGRQIARITEKGSFVMPNGSVHITVVQNDTLAVMSNAWNHAYVYSYDSDMNRIKISSDSKRGTVTIKLGSEYAGREFVIYSGRKSTKVKIAEGILDENGTYSFKADDGRNYTLVIK